MLLTRLPELILQNHTNGDTPAPQEHSFHSWSTTTFQILQDKKYYQNVSPTEYCLRLIDKTEITALNTDFREKNSPTNVLSFPYPATDPFFQIEEAENLPLGDIALCPEVILQEAHEQNKTYLHHFAHITIHGILHLLGYDHITSDEAKKMESLEIEILHALAIANPYNN